MSQIEEIKKVIVKTWECTNCHTRDHLVFVNDTKKKLYQFQFCEDCLIKQLSETWIPTKLPFNF
jgi:hypothetical protein